MTADSPSPSPAPLPASGRRILLVTGMSGAGKSTVLHVLEDLGWDTHDNFPLRLLGDLIAHDESGGGGGQIAVGMDSRGRGFDPDAVLQRCDALASEGLRVERLFLDCEDAEIARRYNETRRPHPLTAQSGSVEQGIRQERALLAPLREGADTLVDTSDMASNHLQQLIREHYAASAARAMTITLTSFGFARGTPPLADLVFDMRFLDNPHWVPELRHQSGLDAGVAAHIENDPAFAPAFARIAALLLELVPRYAAQGRSYLTIAFGCTGGRHRSVYTAEVAAQVLREEGFSLTVEHRNLGGRASDGSSQT